MKYWHTIALIASACILLVPAVAQTEPCPEGKVCLTESQFEKLRSAASHQVCLDEQLDSGDISLTSETWEVVVDDHGRVYSPSDVEMRLEWCDYDIRFTHNPDLVVHRDTSEESDWGWRLRVRLGLEVRPLEFGSTDPLDAMDPAVLIEPFHYHGAHVMAHLSTGSFGIDLGYDLTRNMDVYVGIGSIWTDPKRIAPVLGVSVSLF